MNATPSPKVVPARITAEPIDARRCRFVVDRPLEPGRWAYFADQSAAIDSPLAERLLAIEGIAAVLIAHDTVTVTRSSPVGLPVIGTAINRLRRVLGDSNASRDSWRSVGKRIGEAIRSHLDSGQPALSEAALARMPTSAMLADRVRLVLEEQVNPVLAGHGGGVELVEIKDNVLYLRMGGGCQGCGLADSTLREWRRGRSPGRGSGDRRSLRPDQSPGGLLPFLPPWRPRRSITAGYSGLNERGQLCCPLWGFRQLRG